MPSWPLILPNPSRAYRYNVDTGVMRSRMDSGRARQRRVSTLEMFYVQVKWEFSDVQLRIFQGWLKEYLNGGVDWFTKQLALGDGGLKSYEVRFQDGDYSVTENGVLWWQVSATLEVKEPSITTGDDLQFLMLGGPLAEFTTVNDLLHTLVHVTLPSDLNDT